MSLVRPTAAVTVIAALTPAHATPQSMPSATEIVRLDYDYASKTLDLTCFGYDNAGASRRFDRLFGARLHRVDDWAAKKLGATVLSAARAREFPNGFVMVGGCRVDSRTGEAHDPVPDFAAQLGRVERSIRSSERSGRIAAMSEVETK